MKVANGVECIELKMETPFGEMTINPTLIWDENQAVLVDTGMPGQWPIIRRLIEDAGVALSKLQAVILTHQDIDHIGSIPEIIREFPDIKVFAHEADQPYIEGQQHLIKADPNKMSKERWETLPEEMRAIYENPPKATVTEPLIGGEKLEYGGGITVIHTPGHTPGHLSLYLEQSKTLITADALTASNGILQGPVPRNTPDMKEAIRSLEKLLDYDIAQAICYHGGLVKGDLHAAIRGIIEKANQA